jgi:Carboxypeptidase regulatory-like domain/TonB dependent receptor
MGWCTDIGAGRKEKHCLRPWILVLVCSASLAFSQIITSSITGFVTDSSGAAVPHARITIRQAETGFARTVTTNALGQYTFSGIPAGTYTITAEKPGFMTTQKTGQRVAQQLTARIDFVIQVGSVRQTVTVNSSTPLLDTETSADAVTLSTRQLTELPIQGGSFLSEAILSPGVTPTVSSSILTVVEGESLTGGAAWKPVSVDASGGVPDLMGYEQDGFDVRDPIYGGDLYQPSVDAIQSVQIVRGFDTAQYGGEPSVTYITTKSGTDQYHGSIFEYNQEGALSARPFGTTSAVPLTYNQAGWAFGGPLTPKLKDKTFVFASFQLTRNRSAAPEVGIVPTQAEWAGNLSAFPVQIYNPFQIVNGQRAPFLNNQIPSTSLSSIGQKLKAFVPLPNMPEAPYGSANISTLGSELNDDTQYLIRVDQNLPGDGRLFVEYFRDHVNAISYGLSPFAGTAQPLRGQTASVEWDKPFDGGTMVSQLRAAFFRSVTNYGSVPTSQNIAGSVLGLKNVSTNPLFYGMPSLSVTGMTMPSTLLFNLHRLSTVGGLYENISRVQGRHSIDFGASWVPSQYPQVNGSVPRGSLCYGGGFTSQYPGGTGGTGLSDFLLGTFTTASANPTGFSPLLDTTYWAWYAQDRVKISRRLTLDLGLRWDYWTPPVERHNRWVAFNQNTGTLEYVLKDPLQFMTNDSPGGALPRGMFLNWKPTNFSPRVGFAYLLGKNTTIRGGFGLYYSQGMANFQLFAPLGFGAPPFSNVSTVTNNTTALTPQFLDTELFPAPAVGALTPGTLITSDDIYSPQPYVEQPTLTIEHQFGNNMLVSLGYVGAFGHFLMAPYNVNQAKLVNPADPLPLAQRLPYPFFSDILLESGTGNSTYNGLNAHFEKRYSGGLDLTANYTWSKAMDMYSSNGAGWANQNALCRRCDYGPSDFNRASYFSAGYVWDLPFGSGRKFVSYGPAAEILGHWRFSGITQLMSGTPLNITMPTYWDNVATVFSQARPDRVCNGSINNPSLSRLFDTSCFVAPPLNTFGNSGRNVINGPGAQTWDMALGREFPIKDRFRLNFRADFFSVFNHQNWGSPDTGVEDPTFGEIFTKYDPRIIQFGLRLSF